MFYIVFLSFNLLYLWCRANSLDDRPNPLTSSDEMSSVDFCVAVEGFSGLSFCNMHCNDDADCNIEVNTFSATRISGCGYGMLGKSRTREANPQHNPRANLIVKFESLSLSAAPTQQSLMFAKRLCSVWS